uniref:C-type lectin domain-containing protein n=1 Tax=Cyprinus carpio carpio TaxID=630221 RepID=A0A9J7XEM1_CYPCA
MALHIFKNVSLSDLLLTDTQDTLQDKFLQVELSMNWHDAQIYCRTHYVDLAAITDDTENTFLTNMAINLGADIWIGLHKIPWQWSDESSVSLSSVKWEFGQPNVNGNEDCVKASTEGLMADDSCSTPLPFYCPSNLTGRSSSSRKHKKTHKRRHVRS